MKQALTVMCVMLLSAAIFSSAAFLSSEAQANPTTQSFIGTTPDAPAATEQAPTF